MWLHSNCFLEPEVTLYLATYTLVCMNSDNLSVLSPVREHRVVGVSSKRVTHSVGAFTPSLLKPPMKAMSSSLRACNFWLKS